MEFILMIVVLFIIPFIISLLIEQNESIKNKNRIKNMIAEVERLEKKNSEEGFNEKDYKKMIALKGQLLYELGSSSIENDLNNRK